MWLLITTAGPLKAKVDFRFSLLSWRTRTRYPRPIDHNVIIFAKILKICFISKTSGVVGEYGSCKIRGSKEGILGAYLKLKGKLPGNKGEKIVVCHTAAA